MRDLKGLLNIHRAMSIKKVDVNFRKIAELD